eukprot:Gb_03047 [translate_table: standard]
MLPRFDLRGSRTYTEARDHRGKDPSPLHRLPGTIVVCENAQSGVETFAQIYDTLSSRQEGGRHSGSRKSSLLHRTPRIEKHHAGIGAVISISYLWLSSASGAAGYPSISVEVPPCEIYGGRSVHQCVRKGAVKGPSKSIG